MPNGFLQSYLYRALAAAAIVVTELCSLSSDLASVGGGAAADSRSRYIAIFGMYLAILAVSCCCWVAVVRSVAVTSRVQVTSAANAAAKLSATAAAPV